MVRHALTFAALCAGSGCVTPNLPPVAAASDPAFDEVYLVAFADTGPGAIILERIAPDEIAIVAFDPLARTRTPIAPGVFSSPSPWPDRAALARALASSPLAGVVTDRGYHFAEILDGPPPALFDATVGLEEDAIRVHGNDTNAEVLVLPSDAIDDHRWLISADHRRLGLEVQYRADGAPRVRALYLLDAGDQVAAFWSAEGYAAHVAGDFRAARRLWRRALTANPDAADVLYNLGCADARLGDPEAAIAHLRRAVGIDPDGLREHAREDPDLAGLRQRADFRELVGSRNAD